jgi:hypothetical protein
MKTFNMFRFFAAVITMIVASIFATSVAVKTTTKIAGPAIRKGGRIIAGSANADKFV